MNIFQTLIDLNHKLWGFSDISGVHFLLMTMYDINIDIDNVRQCKIFLMGFSSYDYNKYNLNYYSKIVLIIVCRSTYRFKLHYFVVYTSENELQISNTDSTSLKLLLEYMTVLVIRQCWVRIKML